MINQWESDEDEPKCPVKNGHRFVSHAKPGEPKPLEEKWPRAGQGGDYSCLLCGAWTTYCLSAIEADEKMGPCPAHKEDK